MDFHIGDYDRHLEMRPAPVVAAPPAKAAPAKARARKLSYKEQRELETIEAEIEAAETEAADIEALLNDPGFYITRSAEFPEHKAKLEAANTRTAALYARWEELETLRAQAGA